MLFDLEVKLVWHGVEASDKTDALSQLDDLDWGNPDEMSEVARHSAVGVPLKSRKAHSMDRVAVGDSVNGKTNSDELKRLFELVNELPEGSDEQQRAWDDLADLIFGVAK